MLQLYVKLPIADRPSLLLTADIGAGLQAENVLDIEWFKRRVTEASHIDLTCCSLRINSLFVADDTTYYPLKTSDRFSCIELVGRLPGGKGGFGTLLRGKGARGARTTNFESSRDLQGRRLRNARAPERMRNWLQRKAQEKAIIKAVGGPDKYIGKAMSAQDVLKYYNITLPDGVYNPFEDQDAINQVQEELRASAAEAAISVLDKIDKQVLEDRGLSDSAESNNIDMDSQHDNAKESSKYVHMNTYLDVFDDF